MMINEVILLLFISFGLSLVLVHLARVVAQELDVMDRVGDPLKIHSEPVPYMGGIGFGLAFLLVVVVWLTVEERWSLEAYGMLFGVLSMAGLGFLDDVRGIRPGPRLVCQLTAGAIMWAAGLEVSMIPLAPVSVVLTAVFIAWLINAVNMLDGLDGLAGGVVALSALGFAMVLMTRESPYAAASFALAGVLLAFLVFNFEPASIFMGDAGSYLLGVVLSVFATELMAEAWDLRSCLAAVFLIGVPIFDAGFTVARRRLAGAAMTRGDRSHFYDLAHQRLGSVRRTVLVFYILQVVSVCTGLWLATG